MNILNRLKRFFCKNDLNDFLVLPDASVIRKSAVAGMHIVYDAGSYIINIDMRLSNGHLCNLIRCILNAETQEEAEEILRQLTKDLME